MTPAGSRSAAGPISLGSYTPRPPPSIMAGPPIPRLVFRVAIMMSEQPANAALPAKQKPETMLMRGTLPDSRAKA